MTVYAHDHSFDTADDPSVPDFCGDVDIEGNKVAYNFTLPCDCSTMQDSSPSPAPTSVVISTMSLLMTRFASRRLRFTSMEGLWTANFSQRIGLGTGGYMPNGSPRLFDMLKPSTTMGTVLQVLLGTMEMFWLFSRLEAMPNESQRSWGVISFQFATTCGRVP